MIAAFRHVLTLMRVDRRLVVRFVVTALGRSALSLATILLVKQFLAGVLAQGDLPAWATRVGGPEAALWVIAGLLWIAFLGGSALALDNQVTQQRMVKALELGMMERLLRHLLGLSVAFFERQSHGDILQAVRQDVSELRIAVFALARAALDGVTAVGLFLAAWWLSPRLTWWALIVLPVAVVPVVFLARRALARSRSIRRTGYVLFDAILQLLRGIRVIKVFRAEATETRTTLERSRRYFDELVAMVRVQAFANGVLESVASTGIVLVIVIGGFDVLAGRLDWPTLMAFVLAVRALHGPLNGLSQSIVALATHGASAERVSRLLSTASEVAEAAHPVALTGAPTRVTVERVTFRYGADREPVLREVSFTLDAGETLGIAGPSGAGKSTLLGLVARFFDPGSGSIQLDGVELRKLRLADLYAQLAIVTQEPFLFATTIRENIRCSRPEASDQEVEEAARAVGIDAEIRAMPQGYETVVGSGGTALSGGQAQRINIARALLKNPSILLLDEATSNLDSLSELKVQEALERLMEGRTTLVVAHRLSTLRRADRILVLDRGEAVGLGPHLELLERCPIYRRMWELQQLEGPRGEAGRELSVTLPDAPDSDDPLILVQRP
ncbi:MAG TPA: ABC transporter ATP-binding protein [Gemmatimonadales bacterium]|jgi:subfamily B ATP-binding cassette protein MsbA|nr:ABC transporter ATP-binding protein [Gemmatimonadales bacterium]